MADRGFLHKKIMKSKYSRGFTLAEVLMTLAVIGVVASMSIPALMNSTNNQETVAKVQKAYTTLSNANDMLRANGIDVFGVSKSDTYNAFASVLSIQKSCGTAIGKGCFPTGVQYKYLDDTNFSIIDNRSDGKAILNDGMLIDIEDDKNGCTRDRGDGPLDGKVCGNIYVDVNGFKEPNKVGRDVFIFWITKEAIYPTGITFDTTMTCGASSTGDGCAGKILREKAVNY